MTKQEALTHLRKEIGPGQTIYTVLRSVSSSGMTRHIDVYAIEDNRPRFITGYVAAAAGYRHDTKRGGLVATGCGMDMGFDVVYNLGRSLWPDGAASAIHLADKSYKTGRNGSKEPETDGGYMLRQEWI